MISSFAWIVVADGSRARCFSMARKGAPLEPALDRELVHNTLRSRELASDRPGRVMNSATGMRHALEQRSDPHRYEKQVFANEIADVLAEHYQQQEFANLYLVAPPKMLGDLRKALNPTLAKAVAGELDKDLVKIANGELREHLAPMFDWPSK